MEFQLFLKFFCCQFIPYSFWEYWNAWGCCVLLCYALRYRICHWTWLAIPNNFLSAKTVLGYWVADALHTSCRSWDFEIVPSVFTNSRHFSCLHLSRVGITGSSLAHSAWFSWILQPGVLESSFRDFFILCIMCMGAPSAYVSAWQKRAPVPL